MVEIFYRRVVRARWIVLATLGLLAAGIGSRAVDLSVESPTTDAFPTTHPFVQTFAEHNEKFGGANTVLISVEVDEGTVFNRETLQKIQRISRGLKLIPGINNYQVLSLAERKVKTVSVDPLKGFVAKPLMWPEVPETREGIEAVQESVLYGGRYLGTLVSLDQKATLILAEFLEKGLQPRVIAERLDALVQQEADEHTSIHVIGRPVVVGRIASQADRLGLLVPRLEPRFLGDSSRTLHAENGLPGTPA